MSDSIVICFGNFDFNKADCAFIDRHFGQESYLPHREINHSLRRWAQDISFGPSRLVHMLGSIEDTKTNLIYEVSALDGTRLITIQMREVHCDKWLADAQVGPTAGLEWLDAAMSNLSENTGNAHLNVTSSLRPLLREAVAKVPEVDLTADSLVLRSYNEVARRVNITSITVG